MTPPDLASVTPWPFFYLKFIIMTQDVEVKPFFEYDELIQRLVDRGMSINHPLRAQRKLTQVGYYRLSGYWYTSRKFKIVEDKIQYESNFKKNTNFEDIFDFYLFDKKLRIEFTDALERIEIYLRTIMSHEIGRLNPLAYLDKKQFSKNAFKPYSKIHYNDWIERHNRLIDTSKEDSIANHKKNGKPIPIWVAAEAWDFGALSKFYSILSGKNQDLICNRLGIDNRKELDNWLINLNGVRNRCAHHARLCNKPNTRTLSIPRKGYFNLLDLGENQKNKFFGIISVIWFLLKKIGPSSTWISRIANIIDQKPDIPGLTFKSMGFPENGFPRNKFPETKLIAAPVPVEINSIEKLEKTLDQFYLIYKQTKLQDISEQDKKRINALQDRLLEYSCDIEL